MNNVNMIVIPGKRAPLRAGLWLAQALLAGTYLLAGIAVFVLPAAQISTLTPWAAHLSGAMLKFAGAVDLAAGLGVLLPSLTRIAPGLSATAALCSAILQTLAIFCYALLGMLPAMLAVNLPILALSLFVAWGRSEKAPIAPRRKDRRVSVIDAFSGEGNDKPRACARTRRRAIRRQRESGDAGFPIKRGLRAAPFQRAKEGLRHSARP